VCRARERTERLQVLQALLGVLEQLGVDGLFAAHVYEEAARRGCNCVPRWVRLMDGSGDGLDFHGFTRPTAKAAMAHVLERDFVRRLGASACADGSSREAASAGAGAGAGTIRPLAIIVGCGNNSADGEPVLKEEVQRFLASRDPPLHAVTPPHNPGLLVVSWDQLRVNVMVQRHRWRQTTTGPA
jgi:hypothetical protein